MSPIVASPNWREPLARARLPLPGYSGADGGETERVHAGISSHVECVGDDPHRAADHANSEFTDEESGIDRERHEQCVALAAGVGHRADLAHVIDVPGAELQHLECRKDGARVDVMVDDDVALFERELDAIDAVDVRQRHAHELFLGSAVHRCDVKAADGHSQLTS